MSIVKMNNVTKVYNQNQPSETRAVKEITLEIKEGEFIAVMGPSGCGKSTLLNLIGCMDNMTEGEYYLDGVPIHKMSRRDVQKCRRKYISFIFQHFALMDYYSVYENVELPLLAKGLPKRVRKRKAIKALRQLGILELADKLPKQLSGGQQQRTAIARAIVTQNPILLADEPTGALDQENGRQVLDLLKRINASGTAVVLVTHDPQIADKANRIIRMSDGRIVDDSAN